MTMTNVDTPDEFQQTLEQRLRAFMERNEQFNVQGSWTGDDGLTVSVLVDFGIEDRDTGEYYVGSVSARHEENEELLEELDSPRELAEMDTFMDAERAMEDAIRSVFDTGRGRVMSPPEVSDIDTVSTAVIQFGVWDTRSDVDVPTAEV